MFRRIAQRAARSPIPTIAAGLVVGLLVSLSALEAFAELADDVAEGETRRFDRAVLLWVDTALSDSFDTSMRLITGLGYYWVVIPLMLVASYVFYRNNLKFSAALLAISTAGSAVLATVLKVAFQRARPELFESEYTASFYSFPSDHATAAVGFYGTLALLVAWQLESRSKSS